MEACMPMPVIDTSSLNNVFSDGEVRQSLERVLRDFLPQRRWFRSKGRSITSVTIGEVINVTERSPASWLALAAVAYADGAPETYLLPMTIGQGADADKILDEQPAAAIARLRVTGHDEGALIYDAVFDGSFGRALLDAIIKGRGWTTAAGELSASRTSFLDTVGNAIDPAASPAVMKAEQSNTSLIYQDRLIMKLFRLLEDGVNCDLEVGRFLTETAGYAHIPGLAGALEYRSPNREPVTVAILQQFVHNRGDAWQYTLDAVTRCLNRVLARGPAACPMPDGSLLELAARDIEAQAREVVGDFIDAASLLGRRTAELHLALSCDSAAPDFAPQPFTSEYQTSLYQTLHSLAVTNLELLGRQLNGLPHDIRQDAGRVLNLRDEVDRRLRQVADTGIEAMRIRCHGDYHLGQVLYTGNDFVITDFEGEPARSLRERRIKHSPLRDVAGMIRSFHYAAHSALFGETSTIGREDTAALKPWSLLWYVWSSAAFLKAYLECVGNAPLLPANRNQLRALLDALLIDKAVYEIGYEINNRPKWLAVPLNGMLQLLS
jgi:maltose alpha-D-glucosyltransferase/alpha-amylase